MYAPNGVGLGGRPMQSLAIIALLQQPNAHSLLEEAYRNAKTPGRLVVLCALRSSDADRFTELSKPLQSSTEVVAKYDGCVGVGRTVAELIAEITTEGECAQLPEWKERLLAHYH